MTGDYMDIILNPDDDFVKDLKKQIKKNGGYCASKFERNADNKCICKEFREQSAGMCSCGLYIKCHE